jgi:hypothetical protein
MDSRSFSSSSLSTACFTNNDSDDSYASKNPLSPYPVQALSHIHVTSRVIGLTDATSPSHLVDTGGNFNMTNSLSHLVNVVAIKPFDIGMAAQESRSTSRCTHRGDFPLRMIDGSVFYTPMFYNPQASETILSPESICFHSGGILESWTQSGSTVASHGSVSFFDSMGAEVIAFTLQKRNGLYYTEVSAYAVNSDRPAANHTEDFYGILYYREIRGKRKSWEKIKGLCKVVRIFISF